MHRPQKFLICVCIPQRISPHQPPSSQPATITMAYARLPGHWSLVTDHRLLPSGLCLRPLTSGLRPLTFLPFMPLERARKSVFVGIPEPNGAGILDWACPRFTMKGRLVVSELPAWRGLCGLTQAIRTAAARPARLSLRLPALRKDCRHVGAVSEEERKHRHQQ